LHHRAAAGGHPADPLRAVRGRRARRRRAGAPVPHHHGAADPRDGRDPFPRDRLERAAAVQRGHRHDGRRSEQLHPGARHDRVPERLRQRPHGLRRHDVHAGPRPDHGPGHRPDALDPSKEGFAVPTATASYPSATSSLPVRITHTTHRRSRAMSSSARIACIAVWAVLAGMAIGVLYPLFWMVSSTFKTSTEIFASPWALPTSLSPESFVTAWERGIFQYFVNSVLITVGSLVLVLALGTAASFALTKLDLPFATPITLLVLGGLMISPTMILVPVFQLMP